MTFLNGHINVTTKSLVTAATAITAVLVAFNVLKPEQATQVTAVVVALAAFVVPDRGQIPPA